jgi:Zn-dependent peptidase ImmA (M78 family)
MPLAQQIEAEIIAASLGGPREPPVNLALIAREIGVVDIRQTDRWDGYTDFRHAAPVIYINGMASRTRQRFILAHELAHVMLRNRDVIALITQQGQLELLDNEEKLANRIAAVLLIPDSWIEAMKDADLGLADLESLARQAGIPVKKLITRLATADIDMALLHWQRGKSAWHLIDRPGAPEFLHGYVELSEHGRLAIERLGRRESQVMVECAAAGWRLRISGRGCRCGRHGQDALQLIRPARDIQYSPHDVASQPAERSRAPSQASRPDLRERERAREAPRSTGREHHGSDPDGRRPGQVRPVAAGQNGRP